jgi:hypothetical protein
VVLSCAILAACGCGTRSGLEKVIVSGKISYRGEPIQEGEIRFTPIKGTRGMANITYINRGEYRFTGRGGVQVGTFRVEVLSYRPIPGAKPYTAEQADGRPEIKVGEIPTEQFLPPEYNKKSTLEVTIDSESDEITRDFNLT